MIFARRALQRRLDELRGILGAAEVGELVGRLNNVGKDRLAIAWEVAVLHALSRHGGLGHQIQLSSGRRPDIEFKSAELSFVADVTCVSDEGVEDANPYNRFSELIEDAKMLVDLPLPVAGHRDRSHLHTPQMERHCPS